MSSNQNKTFYNREASEDPLPVSRHIPVLDNKHVGLEELLHIQRDNQSLDDHNLASDEAFYTLET